jgi:hypothetical protein
MSAKKVVRMSGRIEEFRWIRSDESIAHEKFASRMMILVVWVCSFLLCLWFWTFVIGLVW